MRALALAAALLIAAAVYAWSVYVPQDQRPPQPAPASTPYR